MAYLERFRAMVKEIEAHPLLEVVEFTVSPPASDEILASVEEKLGAPLAEPIRSFYQETNGLKLYWKIKADHLADKDDEELDEELDQIQEEYDDYDIGLPHEEEDNDDYDNQFAKINILAIEDCILNRNWKGIIFFDELNLDEDTFDFSGVTYKRYDFGRQLKPFDLFSGFSCMAFFLEEGVGNPKVLWLTSHYIAWSDSKITDFASYLEMLLITRGITEARDKIYQDYLGDKQPPLITGPDYWTEEHVPKLFRNIDYNT